MAKCSYYIYTLAATNFETAGDILSLHDNSKYEGEKNQFWLLSALLNFVAGTETKLAPFTLHILFDV